MKEPEFKIASVYAQTSIVWPGVTGSETTINDAKVKNVKFSFTQFGVLVQAKGLRTIIPYANIKNVVLEKEEK